MSPNFKQSTQLVVDILNSYNYSETIDPIYIGYLQRHNQILLGLQHSDRKANKIRTFVHRSKRRYTHVLIVEGYKYHDRDEIFVFTSSVRKPLDIDLSPRNRVDYYEWSDVLNHILNPNSIAPHYFVVQRGTHRPFNHFHYLFGKFFNKAA